MLLRDLQYAFRNLRRNKLLAMINILGLSIGISACLIIFLIASYELSFDTFQPDKGRIYRVYSKFSGAFAGTNRGLSTGIPIEIRNSFTGIESVTNFHTFSAEVEVPDASGPKDFERANKVIIADPEYFEVFKYYKWLAGDPQLSLREPFKVVLTESRARVYFGEGIHVIDVIGKEIRYQDSLVVNVSGIVEDISERTDLDFTDFISFSTIEKSWLGKDRIQLNNWGNTNSSSQVFVKIAAGITADQIEAQIPRLSAIYQEHNKESNWVLTPTLQPLEEIHFNPEIGIFDSSRSVVEKSTLRILMIIALLLLVIGSINFINLETAQGARRAREVGVRKVLGSSRAKLVGRFLSESFILCFLAVIVSVLFASLAVKGFSSYMPQGMKFDASDPGILTFLLCCLFVVTLLAGLYPAFVLSSGQPALALKNQAGLNTTQSRSAFIRKALTIFQFAFAQVLIVGTIVIGLQIRYMLNKDLGFSSDSVLYINTPWEQPAGIRQSFHNELLQIPEIEVLSAHSAPPLSGGWSSTTMEYDNGKEIVHHNVYLKQSDTTYLKLYNIKLIAGRNLTPIDTINEYLINETYLRLLGFRAAHDALGTTVNKKFTIVGVVKDFHTKSLHSEIEPTVIRYESGRLGFGIKFFTPNNQLADIKQGIKKVESVWNKVYPEVKFDYSFLDESVERYYETEIRIGALTRTATGIAILISCLGLFGLSSFTVIQRTKEIGIRKVLGATVNSIMFLLSADFLKLVVVGFILSAPVAYYLVEQWLEGFAYRMEITAWIFLAAGLASATIAFITISFKTVKAAKSDPVKSLRYE